MRDMLGRTAALQAREALSLILDSLVPSNTGTHTIPIEEACGSVIAETIASPEDIPGFARSTMDGFAVTASDTFGASETSPAYLEASGEILMGQEPDMKLRPGHAIRIATGGMLPKGADAVLMFEYASAVDKTMIEAQRALAPGENVIQRGEDMHKGEVIIERGVRLRPQDVAVLASAGIVNVKVFKRPGVSIISTGNEIVPPSDKLRPGLIRDSNSFLLAALIESSGGLPVKRGIMPDSFSEICRALEASALENDIVLISGGSSVGTRDMTERAIGELGKVMFHSVQLKPGKPFLAGTVKGRPVFGLPGHPRAVAVCFEVFVRPALVKLSGETGHGFRSLQRTVTARLKKSVHCPGGRQEYIDVTIRRSDGELWAEPILGKSGLLRTIVKADGRICVPVGKLGLEAGERVEVTIF
jgi:molybdopterin molybdotransferase